MKIVLVLDQYDNGNNGTTITAQRYARSLRERGHHVVVLSTGRPTEDKVTVKELRVPVFGGLIHSHGMCFGKPEDKAYYDAFKGADIVHFFMPFPLCRRGEDIARQMHIPTIAAFHTQPENITYTLGMGHSRRVNDWIYHYFYACFYNRFNSIHCPSRFIADELKAHGYPARLHVISNGVADAFRPMETPRPPEFEGRLAVLMIGRLAGEKRQDLIIEAARRSRYRDKIQLVFAGRGPLEHKYRRLSRGLPHPPIFKFCGQSELLRLINSCDLYVHASDAEIEGISCMEAFSCGLTPVISDSPLSATRQFALDGRSLFRAGDAGALAEKMDYWFDHPEERREAGRAYAALGDTLRVDACVDKAEEMYREAIELYHRKGYPKPYESRLRRALHPNVDKADYHYCPRSLPVRMVQWLATGLLTILLTIANRLFFGLRIEGRRNLADVCGGVTVMNHIHPMDCTMVKTALFPARVNYTALRRNLELPVTGYLVRWLGGVPIPDVPSEMRRFQKQMEEEISRGAYVHFYPEGQLVRYDTNLREFRRGAFVTAVRTGSPVIPMVLLCRRPDFPRSLWKRRPCFTLAVCEPQYANPALAHGAAVEDLMQRTRRVMEERMRNAPRKGDRPVPARTPAQETVEAEI